jgi:prophage DNA circulation protein
MLSGAAYTRMSEWVDEFTAAADALAEALRSAAADPADGIRLLLPLTSWLPPPFPGQGGLVVELNAAQDAIAGSLRSAACAALGRAAQGYQPRSYQDASATRNAVCGALGAEATRAADAGRDETYAALRDLRAAVALDLAVRGANLAWLVEVTTRQTEPSLVEAWTLYQDTTREPELVGSADPPHPLFLPLDFPALQF